MKEPDLVSECLAEMKNSCNIPVTAKTRIGFDDTEEFDYLNMFINKMKSSGCKTIILHARKAILKGLTPKQNLNIPKLNYQMVYDIKKSNPDLEIIINGGINNIDSIEKHLKFVDGVMIGREIYKNPFFLREIEEYFFKNKNKVTRKKILEKLVTYIESEIKINKASIQSITRHTFGLFTGIKGSKKWKRYLNDIKFMKGNVKDIILNGVKNINE